MFDFLMSSPAVDAFLTWADKGLLDASAWQIVAYTLLLTHITIASVTIFLHRSQAHRSLDLHAIPSHFFRFWLWLTTATVTKQWVAVHRKHHAKCETAEDPHSPVAHGIETVLLRGRELYAAEAANAETLKKYGHNTPNDWLENNLYTPRSAWGIFLMLAIDLALFGAIGITVWAVQMVWIPITAAGIINGLGHWWGYRNFEAADASTNVSPWGILIGGEELHNNHHTFATSARLSNRWYEFDIGWMYIRILEMLGLATVRKIAPVPRLATPRAAVDAHTLQAVIAHRYDLMAAYGHSLARTLSEEVNRLRPAQPAQASALKSARQWLPMDTATWTPQNRESAGELLAMSAPLSKLVEMRSELAAIWERSNASAEQLLSHLQDWCRRAEESGVSALQELALRMRSYKAA